MQLSEAEQGEECTIQLHCQLFTHYGPTRTPARKRPSSKTASRNPHTRHRVVDPGYTTHHTDLGFCVCCRWDSDREYIPLFNKRGMYPADATASQQCEFVAPVQLYFSWKTVIQDGQFWRIFTNFMYFGNFSFDLAYHLFFM
jgi:hypothetical protein